jgi:hypothetical protein
VPWSILACVSFDSPILAIFAMLCAMGVVAIAWIRGNRFSLSGRIAGCGALVLLALAAGSPQLQGTAKGRAIIMADFSESTRGADYRDGKLIADLSRRFGAGVVRFPPEGGDKNTTFNPPDADAILLFSDGQFELPAFAPRVYPIIDSSLAAAKDASVADLRFQNRDVVATVANNGDAAALTFSSSPARLRQISQGITSIAETLARNTDAITVRIDSQDLWLENNALTIAPSPPLHLEKWWIGNAPPVGEWRSRAPSNLPAETSSYLLPAVIVLDAVELNQLSPAQAARLEQYVRDLGGSLVLHNLTRQLSFSPLSDSPPQPQRRWVILCDVSGSMAQNSGNARRVDKAFAAVRALVPTLPTRDRVDIGGFARDLTWWTSGKSVADVAELDFVPKDISPSGPTNLDGVLQQLSKESGDALPTTILMISDAEAELPNANRLIESLTAAKTSVSLLQVGDSVTEAMDQLIRATNGHRVRAGQDDWTPRLQAISAAASNAKTVSGEARFAFDQREYPASGVRESWVKENAKLLASVNISGQSLPIAAEWMAGAGKVVAVAADSREFASDLALAIASPPADPRLSVSVDTGEMIRIRIDARDKKGYLNGLALHAQLGDGDRTRIPQVGPGEYELSLLSPQSPSILSILRDGAVSNRIAMAGRYPREFARIGLNLEKLRVLANRTGGKLIDGKDIGDLAIFRRESRDISPLLLSLAGGCLGILLWLWKTGRLPA